MVKGRTPVLMMFGMHGTTVPLPQRKQEKARQRALKGDVRFFRKAPERFFRERILAEGRRGVVIHELVKPPKRVFQEMQEKKLLVRPDREQLLKEEVPKSLLDEIQEHLDGVMEEWRAFFAATLDAGLRLTGDWGFERRISRCNRADPGRIINMIEPQKAESLMMVWREEIASEKLLEAPDEADVEELVPTKIEVMRTGVMTSLIRDRNLFELVEGLAREDPERAIIIPRGTAHRWMVPRFFADSDLFDMEVHVSPEVPSVSRDASAREYMGEPVSEQEWERVARLNLHYSWFANNIIHNSAFYRVVSAIDQNYADRWLGMKSAQYAYSMC